MVSPLNHWETKNEIHLGKHWGNATEIVGEEPNHKNITKMKFSDSRKMKNDCLREEEIHSNPKSWISHSGNFHPFEREPNVGF